MDELKYIKGLLREWFDIKAAVHVGRMDSYEDQALISRMQEITSELKELSGFNQDE